MEGDCGLFLHFVSEPGFARRAIQKKAGSQGYLQAGFVNAGAQKLELQVGWQPLFVLLIARDSCAPLEVRHASAPFGAANAG